MRIFGRKFVFEHITDCYIERIKRLSYDTYITDCLKLLCGANRRWYDAYEAIDNPQPERELNETQVKNILLSKYNRTVTSNE